MNIKLEIDGKKYEIDVKQVDGRAWLNRYGERHDWAYEVWDRDRDEPQMIIDDDGFEDVAEAAGEGLSALIQILTNDDHSIDD
jgi:hypothetical protein